MDAHAHRRGFRGDAWLAIGIAALLSAVWAMRDWGNLVARHLPDTDDAVRLQQIRDWLGGQAFADLAQHRLAGGLAMHWSRLPDLVPGAIIAGMTPLIGAARAELIAVILWPALLFAAALTIVARIARAADPATARTAIIVAAIAYPATTLFLPGRIDHHGLQILVLLVVVRAAIAAPSAKGGTIIGFAAATSLVIGMEMAPFLAVAAMLLMIDWARARDGSGAALAGFGAALIAGMAIGGALFASRQFDFPGCDGFTGTVWRLAMAGGGAAILLALSGFRATTMKARLAIAGIVAALFTGLALPIGGPCLRPYGAVDPLVARLWLDQVGEAQSIFAAPWTSLIGYGSPLIIGIIAGCWRLRSDASRGWAVLLAFQGASLLVAMLELRGAYAGVMIGAPALAAVIGAARQRGAMALAGAWIGSAGMLYPIAAQALVAGPAQPAQPPQAGATCTDRAVMRQLAALPPGTLMAPIDAGAYALAETPHRLIAAPYHRNNAGNAAMYRFFMAEPDAARHIAAQWRIDYVLLCDPAPPGPLAARLRGGRAPAWLQPIGAGLWRVR